MMDFAAIDFETANSHRGSVCSVGVVIVRNGEITERFYSLIRPRPNFYSYYCTKVHGLTTYDTDEAMEFPDVWEQIEPKLRGLPLVAHNSPFDEGCLKAVYDIFDMFYPGYKFHCSCRLARKAFPYLQNHKLDTVARHIGFDLTNHHHALADAEACASIIQAINK